MCVEVLLLQDCVWVEDSRIHLGTHLSMPQAHHNSHASILQQQSKRTSSDNS